jgi:nitroreductase
MHREELTTAEATNMTLDQIITKRFSVRDFDQRPVPREHIIAMCEAARWAPSACNSQTWRFIAVSDPERIARICKEAMGPVIGNKWLRHAPLLIVGCSKLDIVANRIGTGVTGIEYYPIDFGIAMEHIVLKATELGLGTCWVGWLREEKVKEILSIPKRVRAMALLAVGYPKSSTPPKRSRKTLDKILFAETWDNPFPISG